MSTDRAIVVGAGAGGLVAAWELARAGVDVTVLEAWQRPGGLVGRAELAGLTLDVGAEGYSVRGGTVAQLLTDLDAAGLIVQPAPVGAWLQTSSGPHPLPKRLIFGLPGDPQAADVRAVVGEIPAEARGARAQGSFGELVRHSYGQRVLDDLVTPLVGGVYLAVPDDVALADLSPDLAEEVASGKTLRQAVEGRAATAPAGAVHGIRGGMHRLVDLLLADAEAAPGRFSLSVAEPVTGLARGASGWTVTTTRRTLTAPMVVLAVGLGAASRLLGGPEVPEASRIDVVTLVLDPSDLAERAPRGTGVLVGAGVPGVAAKAMTHSTAKWPWLRGLAGGRDVLRLSYGRSGQPPITSHLETLELEQVVRADAEALLGCALPGTQAVRRTGWYVQPPGRSAVATARQWLTGRREPGLALVGAGVAGVGLANVVGQARTETNRLLRSVDE